MNEIQIFNNPRFGEVRTITEDGRTLFCGSDIAKALGYARPNEAVTKHCKGTLKRRTPTAGGVQEMLFIPEGDLYRLIANSKLEAAQEFESWIFDEVLPSIRKTGGYISGQETLSPEELMAKALMVAQKTLADREARISALTVENQIMQPKAEFFDDLCDRGNNLSFRNTAKLLHVPERKFINSLLAYRYIYRDKKGKLVPYAQYVDSGIFVIKEQQSQKNNWAGIQTLVTVKGRELFMRMALDA